MLKGGVMAVLRCMQYAAVSNGHGCLQHDEPDGLRLWHDGHDGRAKPRLRDIGATTTDWKI